MAITQRRLTLTQFLDLPESEPALELHNGVVTQKLAPTGPHSGLQTDLASSVNSLAIPHQLGRAFCELRASFGGSSYVPDVSVYRWDRVPTDEHGDLASYSTEPPDIAIEIISPGQLLADLVERCQWYVDHGARSALLVNPRNRTILVFRPGIRLGPLADRDQIDLGDIIPGVVLVVGEVFRSVRARLD